jgi:hypothetical protein
MISKFFKPCSLTIIISMFLISFSVWGADIKPVAEERITPYGIIWVAKTNYAELELTIARPDGTVFRKLFPSGAMPSAGIDDILGESRQQGSFIYELRMTVHSSLRSRSEGSEMVLNHEGKNDLGTPAPELTQSGAFLVADGSIVTPTMQEIRAAYMPEVYRPEDQVIADDLITTGSLCVGFDCVNNESFGFDTIRLKENNTRIKFDDTSATAGFPATDWQLTANDSASGGANKFSIEDITSAKVPFTISGGAPTNSLFVSSTGRLGLKTATPVLDIHTVNGNTPAVRLEQNGTSGFTPQTWDIAGNEANFFIRDVTGGSKLPFRIQPGTPTNTLTLKSEGHVGIGTWSPGFPLEIMTTGKSATMVLTRTDGVQSFVNATSSFGQFGTTTNHPVRIIANGAYQAQVNSNSSIAMANSASLTAGGVWTNASSRELKDNIQTLTTSEAFETLTHLNAVKYNYKADREEKHVGFIAEDAPDLVASKDKKGMSPMDVVAVLTKVVQEQQKSLQDQQAIISELQRKVAAMEKK